jgi:hypothetical protein
MGDRFEGSERRGAHWRCVSTTEGGSVKGIGVEATIYPFSIIRRIFQIFKPNETCKI